jgi:hypothetical protein
LPPAPLHTIHPVVSPLLLLLLLHWRCPSQAVYVRRHTIHPVAPLLLLLLLYRLCTCLLMI